MARFPFRLLCLLWTRICCHHLWTWGMWKHHLFQFAFNSWYFMIQKNVILISDNCVLQMAPVFDNSEKFQNFAKSLPGQIIIFIVLKLYTVLGMGFCFSPLVLLSFHRYWTLHRSLWFFGYILWLPWPIYKPLLKNLLGSKRPERKTK